MLIRRVFSRVSFFSSHFERSPFSQFLNKFYFFTEYLFSVLLVFFSIALRFIVRNMQSEVKLTRKHSTI